MPDLKTCGAQHPRELTITFTSAVAMNGLVLMNRQNDRDHLGDICGCLPATRAAGVTFLQQEGDFSVFRIGSGSYSFTAVWPR